MSHRSDVLDELYPFLDQAPADRAALDRALRESVAQKAAHSVEVKQRFFAEQTDAIVACAHAIADVYRHGGRWLAMGNGGSACDAAHFTVEFLHPITAGRPALPVIDLSADAAMLTAVGNDVGFEHVFLRPLLAQARAGDGLIGFSTSGNSASLLRAFAKARELGLTTIGLSGHDGGTMARDARLDHCLVVATDSIHRVQETHVALYHILWDLVHTLLADARRTPTQRDPEEPPP